MTLNFYIMNIAIRAQNPSNIPHRLSHIEVFHTWQFAKIVNSGVSMYSHGLNVLIEVIFYGCKTPTVSVINVTGQMLLLKAGKIRSSLSVRLWQLTKQRNQNKNTPAKTSCLLAGERSTLDLKPMRKDTQSPKQEQSVAPQNGPYSNKNKKDQDIETEQTDTHTNRCYQPLTRTPCGKVPVPSAIQDVLHVKGTFTSPSFVYSMQ